MTIIVDVRPPMTAEHRSLKSSLGVVATILGVSRHHLYNRQLILMGQGVLDRIEGHGPGSGVPLNATSISAVIAHMLIVDSSVSAVHIDGEIIAEIARGIRGEATEGDVCVVRATSPIRREVRIGRGILNRIGKEIGLQ